METPGLDELDRRGRLEVDIDVRLAAHWPTWLRPGTALSAVMERSDVIRDMVGAVVRTAYAQGYIDALREEKDGRRAELHRTHGYRPE